MYLEDLVTADGLEVFTDSTVKGKTVKTHTITSILGCSDPVCSAVSGAVRSTVFHSIFHPCPDLNLLTDRYIDHVQVENTGCLLVVLSRHAAITNI